MVCVPVRLLDRVILVEAACTTLCLLLSLPLFIILFFPFSLRFMYRFSRIPPDTSSLLENINDADKALEYYEQASQLLTSPEAFTWDKDTSSFSQKLPRWQVSQAIHHEYSQYFSRTQRVSSHHERALAVIARLSHEAERKEDIKLLANCCGLRSAVYYAIQDKEKAEEWAERSREYEVQAAKASGTSILDSMSLQSQIIQCERLWQMGHLLDGMVLVKRLVEKSSEGEDKELTASLNHHVVRYYRKAPTGLFDLREALPFGVTALDLYTELYGEVSVPVRNVYLSLTDIYMQLGDLTNALEHYKKELEINRSLQACCYCKTSLTAEECVPCMCEKCDEAVFCSEDCRSKDMKHTLACSRTADEIAAVLRAPPTTATAGL